MKTKFLAIFVFYTNLSFGQAPIPLETAPPSSVNFNHQLHMKMEGVSCETCHSPSEEVHRTLPTMETCLNCHVQKSVQKNHESLTNCTSCHSTIPTPGVGLIYTKDKLESDHWVTRIKKVFPKVGQFHESTMNCTDCHQNAVNSKLSTDNIYPNIHTCYSCHCDPNVIDPY